MSINPHLGLWKPKPKFRISALVGIPAQVRLDGAMIRGKWKERDGGGGTIVEFDKRFPLEFLSNFLNWDSAPTEILRFTKKYGPLTQTPHTGAEWEFTVEAWRDAQADLRDRWETFAGLIAPAIKESAKVGDEVQWRAVPRNQRRSMDASKFDLRSDEFLTFDQTQNEITFQACNLWRYLKVSLQALPSDRLSKCKRPAAEGCDTPYFVAEHLNSEYCSEPCQHWGQKQVKKEWWHRSQEEKRKRQSDRRKSLKQSKKGGKH